MIHKLADVLSNSIGDDTVIWQYSVVLQGAVIGKNCNINCHTFIENDVEIGNNVTIKSGVYLWDGVTLEDNVLIGPGVLFTNDLRPRSKQDFIISRTRIKKGASLGAGTTVLAGITIGEFAMTGIASNITKDIPAHALVFGNPGVIRGWVDEKGRPLKQLTDDLWFSQDGIEYICTKDGMKIKV